MGHRNKSRATTQQQPVFCCYLFEKQNHSYKDGLALQGCLWFGSLECSPEMSEEGHPQLRVLGSQT